MVKKYISQLGFYYASHFFGNYINLRKDKIEYVPLYPVIDYVYISDLSTRLCIS